MKIRFSTITSLQLFSLAIMLLALAFILKLFGTDAQVTQPLLGNALLLTGLVGTLAAIALAAQKRELDALRAEVSGLLQRHKSP
jgi:hypothetical protein